MPRCGTRHLHATRLTCTGRPLSSPAPAATSTSRCCTFWTGASGRTPLETRRASLAWPMSMSGRGGVAWARMLSTHASCMRCCLQWFSAHAPGFGGGEASDADAAAGDCFRQCPLLAPAAGTRFCGAPPRCLAGGSCATATERTTERCALCCAVLCCAVLCCSTCEDPRCPATPRPHRLARPVSCTAPCPCPCQFYNPETGLVDTWKPSEDEKFENRHYTNGSIAGAPLSGHWGPSWQRSGLARRCQAKAQLLVGTAEDVAPVSRWDALCLLPCLPPRHF